MSLRRLLISKVSSKNKTMKSMVEEDATGDPWRPRILGFQESRTYDLATREEAL